MKKEEMKTIGWLWAIVAAAILGLIFLLNGCNKEDDEFIYGVYPITYRVENYQTTPIQVDFTTDGSQWKPLHGPATFRTTLMLDATDTVWEHSFTAHNHDTLMMVIHRLDTASTAKIKATIHRGTSMLTCTIMEDHWDIGHALFILRYY